MSNPHDIFTERGITHPDEPGGHVARAQGFVRYEGSDWHERRAIVAEIEPLYGSDDHPDSGKANELWMRAVEKELGALGRSAVARFLDKGFAPTKEHAALARVRERLPQKVRQSWEYWLREALSVDGWLMPRHAVMPDHEDFDFRSRPVAQLRPDRPVQERPYWHSHRRLSQKAYGPEDASPRTRHELKVGDLDDEGEFIPTGHLHPHTGKVMIPHEGRHGHVSRAKYLYTPGNTARRLGTNPVALERGWGGPDDLFVFVMEGTLKMCAVVEAEYPAIDAGSVTLWESATPEADLDDEGFLTGYLHLELTEFAERHLQGRPLAVICDSDWHANPLVFDQTARVVGLLNNMGARAVACAPPEGEPLDWIHPLKGEMRDKIGVDDWLGKSSPWLDKEYGPPRRDLLDIVYREPAGEATLTADDPRLAGFYRNRRQTVVDVVLAIGAAAAPGTLTAPYRESAICESLGRSKSRVQEAAQIAAQVGLLERITEAERTYVGGNYRMVAPWMRVTPEAVPPTREVTLRKWLRALSV